MAKKLEQLAEESEGQLAKTIMESANQIWLAGLGAFSKAQEEGAKMFEALVKEGERGRARRRATVWGRSPPEPARAGTSWNRFSKGGLRAPLATLNVPIKRDIDTLSERVTKLTEVVDKLTSLTEGTAVKGAPAEKVNEKV